MGYSYLFLTIILTVYGHVVLNGDYIFFLGDRF